MEHDLCGCGHLDINHSDIDLDALGACYECGCRVFLPLPASERCEYDGTGLRFDGAGREDVCTACAVDNALHNSRCRPCREDTADLEDRP